MKYSELIHFEPIDTVVQLREANAADEARRLVSTYVISRRMEDLMRDVVVPQLQFAKAGDTKGLFVVGNYGTGKSHLMATLSAIAEHADLTDSLTSSAVRDVAVPIAGRFKVIRTEIGSTTMSLRQIVCGVLEEGLSGVGVSYEFPSASERHENKTAFEEMMSAFQAKHPKLGLLLVVDELLDYLRSRKDQELSLDLSFLRELGEICRGSRFRFMAGVQETLFDNPRFQFVADTLRRVKDRFEQVRIAREDVAYVVAERLLRKTSKQQGMIREHLQRFASCFGSMNERMDEFVRLFPVHPAYLDTFERVYVAEKREVLKTLSLTIRKLMDQQVPEDGPGVIAYDSYWQVLRDNPSFRSVPEIKDVIDRTGVLEARIQQAFTRPAYRPAALRVIHGLAVHRLTTADVYAPIGPTAEELRDDLCLLLPVPEKDADFMKTMVETVLREIVKTVSGQFLSANKENGQYYLDLKKDVDFDSLIEKKGESLADSQLDRYYFDALKRVVLENPDLAPHVPGYNIWEYELEWKDRRAGRGGYLFFGAPNERSTAQPPRDFYLYFLQAFEAPYFKDEKKADEVFLRLRERDEAFDRLLRVYAGAREQAATASGANKRIYEDKATEHLRALTGWLRERITSAFDVSYQGRSRSLGETIQGRIGGGLSRASVRDLVDVAASTLLASHFADLSPDYPTFSVRITRDNREQATQEALRWISGSRTQQGAAVLDALGLLDGDVLKPRESRYARHVLDLLSQKGQGQVLNRAELVQAEPGGVEYWTRFRIEPELLVVVLAALVHSGDLVLSAPGRRIDASAIEQLAKVPISELREFKHVDRPRDLPLAALQELCDLLGVPRGLMVDPAQRDEAISQIQQAAARLLNRVVKGQSQIPELVFWGRPVLGEKEQADLQSALTALKAFLESLQPFNTAGKLKNFPHDTGVIAAQRSRIEAVGELEELCTLLQQVAPLTAYLGKAEAVLAADDPWAQTMRERRTELLARVASAKQRSDGSFARSLSQALADSKQQYQDAYLAAHRRYRLAASEDKKKGALVTDPRLARLQKLSGVEMMPAQQLRDLENRLLGLKTCYSVTREELEADPLCPACRFRPVEEPPAADGASVLAATDDQLDTLVRDWTATLLANLEDPTVAANIELVSDKQGRVLLERFRTCRELPQPVPPALVKALQEVMSGLHKVVVTGDGVRAALLAGGVPCTVEELKRRFDQHVAGLTKGKDVARVRVVVE